MIEGAVGSAGLIGGMRDDIINYPEDGGSV